MFGTNKYNSKATTLISAPLINDVWNDLNGGSGVTVGTDIWDISDDISPLVERLFFSRVGGSGASNALFNVEDRPYIHNVRICCNFADGLVPVSNTTQQNVASPIIANPLISSVMTFRMETQRVLSDNTIVGNGSFDFYIPTFQDKFTLQQFAPYSTYVNTDKGFYLSATLNNVGAVAFSTLSIATAFQDSRVLIWAEVDVEHTFPLETWS